MTPIEFSKVLVFSPHPDDAEFSCGASMARWASEGKQVVVCVVTNGAAGSNDPEVRREDLIKTREREQKEASEIVGATEVVFLGYEDGYIEDSHELRRDLIREIRRHKPDVVVGPDPATFYLGGRYANHPDHRILGAAVLAAVNPGATTVPLYRSELYDQGFEPHKVKGCLLAMTNEPDYFVDVNGFVDVKTRALRAHHSQMGAWEGLPDFIKMMAAMEGERSPESYSAAEGFRSLSFLNESAGDQQS